MPLTKKEFAEMAEKLSNVYFPFEGNTIERKDIQKCCEEIVSILAEYREKDESETPPITEKL